MPLRYGCQGPDRGRTELAHEKVRGTEGELDFP